MLALDSSQGTRVTGTTTKHQDDDGLSAPSPRHMPMSS